MKTHRVLKEMKADLLEVRMPSRSREKLAVGVSSCAAWANRPLDLGVLLGNQNRVQTTRWTSRSDTESSKNWQGEAQGPICLCAEVQALADAEQDLCITGLPFAEFLQCALNISDVNEAVQLVSGTLVVNATTVFECIHGASGPQVMEEKRTAIEMLGTQRGIKKQSAILQ